MANTGYRRDDALDLLPDLSIIACAFAEPSHGFGTAPGNSFPRLMLLTAWVGNPLPEGDLTLR